VDETLDVSKLIKAQQVFERFRTDMKDDRDQAGAVQAFEFCYELSWKMMRRFLLARGQDVGSPKDIFRKAALEKLIDDPEVWFEFQKKRNLTTHTYEQANLDIIVNIFDQFSQELKTLLQRLQTMS
jgi:nucleotidyltransferase substrate binding protein (TIGR01987 family)